MDSDSAGRSEIVLCPEMTSFFLCFILSLPHRHRAMSCPMCQFFLLCPPHWRLCFIVYLLLTDPPSPRGWAHGCGPRKTPSLLAKSERWSLQWKLGSPGTWGGLLSRGCFETSLKPCGRRKESLFGSEPGCLSIESATTSAGKIPPSLPEGFLLT